MSLDCNAVRERIADEGATPELQVHLVACPQCAAIARALVEVDGELASLGTIEPPDALVAATLLRAEDADRRPAIAEESVTDGVSDPRPGEPLGAGSLLVAALAVIASALGALVAAPFALARWLVGRRAGRWTFALGSGLAACAALLTVTFRASAPALELAVLGRHEDVSREAATAQTPAAVEIDGERWAEEPEEPAVAPDVTADVTTVERLGFEGDDDVGVGRELHEQRLRAVLSPIAPAGQPLRLDGTIERDSDLEQTEAHFEWRTTLALPAADHRGPESPADRGEGAARPAQETDDLPAVDPGAIARQAEVADVTGLADAPELPAAERSLDALQGQDDGDLERNGGDAPRFWSEAERIEGLSFHARDGWWSTTYVPGDPAIRALHARLAAADVRLGAREGLALAVSAAPLASPIEAPADRALAMAVQADVAAVEGPTRVRLEVDLRAIRQSAGRRAPMRIAVVIDARGPLGPDEASRLRALLAALGRAAGARDRVTVLAAGAHGGTLVPLGALRHGEVEVALRRLLAGEGGAVLSADAALADGARAVASADDVGLVLFATPDAAHDASIDGAVHRAAVAGVPTSVVAIGARARTEDLDAIAIAGHGRRRIVRAPADADAVARAEIEAASQLVARAMRIRVRLAPGVQLVDVVGSRPLDADESRRTREAERAVDVDLAQRLGISSDREVDDDGIRIFVPAFYADDAHSVLLDVVVPGPGPIAEVDVRYKDLVRLENGLASSALSLPRGRPSRGARELRVVGSMLAHEASRALATAGDRARSGDREGAAVAIREARATIDEARRAMPRLARDRATTSLRRLLDGYLDALESSADPALIAASARYASHRLIVRPRL